MGLYERFKKYCEDIVIIFCPQEKMHKFFGFSVALFFPFILDYFGLLNKLGFPKTFSEKLFVSLMFMFGLSIRYDIYDNKRKRRLKRLKEIYESYYWLVTHINPYRIGLNTGLFNYIKFIPEVRTVYPYPPDCLYTAIEEMGMKDSVFKSLSLEISTSGLKTKDGKIPFRFRKVIRTMYHSEHCKGEAYMYGTSPYPREPLDGLNSLFRWHFNKGLTKDHCVQDVKTKEPICRVEDIKGVWEQLKLDPIIDVAKIATLHNNLLTEIMPMEFDLRCELERYEGRLNHYFVLQHNKNLMKLSDC